LQLIIIIIYWALPTYFGKCSVESTERLSWEVQNNCNTVYPRHTVCFKDIIVNNLQNITDNNDGNNSNDEKKEDKGKEKQ
jgi:hypothetical protein